MKRLQLLLASCAFVLLSLPVYAQQLAQGSAFQPGYGPMGRGVHPGMIFLAPFVLLLALIGFVTVIMGLVRFFSHRGHPHWRGCAQNPASRPPGRALDILEERFARGEIDKTEFEEKKKLLGR